MTLNDFLKIFSGNRIGQLTHEISSDGEKINQRVQIDDTQPIKVIGRSEKGAIRTGSKSNIGTEVVQITEVIEEVDVPINQEIHGVEVIADDDNTGSVYVGLSNNVTPGTNDATDGVRLTKGNSIYISADNLNQVYLIGSTTGQKVYYLAI